MRDVCVCIFLSTNVEKITANKINPIKKIFLFRPNFSDCQLLRKRDKKTINTKGSAHPIENNKEKSNRVLDIDSSLRYPYKELRFVIKLIIPCAEAEAPPWWDCCLLPIRYHSWTNREDWFDKFTTDRTSKGLRP